MSASVRPVSKAADIAYVRFQVPDLARMGTFLEDFGLTVSEGRTAAGARALYSRGTGGSPYVHVAEEGETGFIGLGLEMSARADLEALAAIDGAAPIAPLDGPGGGERVRFIDPNGFEIDAVYGRGRSPGESAARREPVNNADARPRVGEPVRLGRRLGRVRRLGHCVLNCIDFRESEAWYKERFGFLTSDEIHVTDEGRVLGAFMRCDRGGIPVDHHTIFVIGAGAASVNHVAFEVEDWDAVMLGHTHLTEKGYEPFWGVGKHILGSQVFDYWKDPFGFTVEHFTDSDLYDASQPPKVEPVEIALGVQWGPEHESMKGKKRAYLDG
ncbi:MAG: VOC family protein [Caulobacterales bacterium]|nr:VOC family protein [Caulobacterales bacterium]